MSASKHRAYHKLQLAAHRLQKAADRAVMAATRITTAQAAVLSIVASDGPVTQRSVARKLGLNESAMTAMTARLCNMGLLERQPDPDDSRAWSLQVSAEGRAALKRIEQPFRRINQRIEAVLNAEEIARLADYASRIIDAFEKP